MPKVTGVVAIAYQAQRVLLMLAMINTPEIGILRTSRPLANRAVSPPAYAEHWSWTVFP